MADNAIRLKGDYRREEYTPAAIFSPGHWLEMTSAGKAQKHSTEGGAAERLIAVADVLQGKEITDAYAVTDLASVDVPEPGAVYQVFLQAAQTAVIGSALISGGDGTLIVNGQEASATTVVGKPLAEAVEAKDLSASGAVDTLMKVRLL